LRLFSISLFILLFSSCEKWSHVTANADYIEVQNGVIYFENERFTGNVIKFNSTGSDTFELYAVRDGKQHGRYQTWYVDGMTNEKRFYKDNRPDGHHQKWYPNGKQAFDYHFEDGVYTDTLKEWYPNGQLYLLSHYVNGQQVGRQQAWRANGELYLNYDVVKGRKYGNAGNKHCKSLWSEVTDSM